MCNKGRRIRSAGVDGNADYGVLVLIVPVAFVPRDRDTAREVSVPLWWSWISFVWIEATEGIKFSTMDQGNRNLLEKF